MKRRLLASILSFVMVLSLMPVTAMADGEDDVTLYNTSEEEPQNGLSGPCGATEDDTVAWALTENNDSLYCVTKTTGDTTSWRFYENTADVEEGQPKKVQAYTLTISGKGAMANYARNDTPWGLALAALLSEATTGNNVSDFCSPHITQVVFTEDSNVTYIGAHAFRSTSISSITIPDSVKSIGAYAFIMCRQLSSIAAAKLEDRAFYAEEDVLYENYTENGQSGVALRFFPLAKWAGVDYTVDSRVTAIGSNSMQMSEIKSVTIPASVRSINSYAFNSSAIESVTFNGVPSFGTEFENNALPGAGAFSSCENLTTINDFPQSVAKLPNNLFSGDVRLTEFDIPGSVTEIGNSAFANTGITEIEIPAGVTTIGSGVFSTSAPAEGEAPVRTSIAVNFEEGSKLASIGSACFDGLSYKATFDAEDTLASKVFSQAGYQISFYGQTLPEDVNLVYGWADASSLMVVGLTENGEKESSIAIPATATAGDKTYPVVGIGDSVFAGTADDDAHANTTLKSVKLGANIESIGGRAFKYCTGLTTVDFSSATKLARIGDNAFYDAKSVTAWDLSACTALTTVEDSAFLYGFSTTTTIKLPDSITSWGKNVISSAPVKVYVDVTSTTFTTLVSVLDKKSDTFTFGGETGVYENLAYETQYKNGKYTVTITGFASEATEKDEVVIPDEIKGMKVTAVAEKAFSDAYKQIKRVTIGKNVSQIGNYAFAPSSSSTDGTLESVTFDEGVPVSVGTRAFQKYKDNFTTFDAGNRELTLGDNVFLGSSALKLINIPNVKSLGKGVFHGHENTEGTLIINGEAACDPLTFKNSTGGTNAADSLTKMTIYALGSASEVKNEVKALGDIGSNILCLTNGGVIDVTQDVNATTGLYTPVYNGDGKVFDGWYDSNGKKLTGNASHGTYTAKWLDSAYTVVPTEVELSYTYGDETLTAGTVEVTTSGEGFIRTATVNSENFTLAVNGLKITVTPKSGLNAGEYEGTIVVTTGDSATHTVPVTLTVAKKSIPVPSEDNTKYTYTGEDQTYQVKADEAYTVTGNVKKDAGEYTVTIKLNDKDNTVWAGKDNADDLEYAFVIDKAAQDAPAAPTLKDRSYTSITLNEVAANDNGATAEYSVDGENWQPFPTFTGLTSGTTYTFYVRYAATDNYNASPASDAVKFTTRRQSSATVTPTPTPEPEPTPDDSTSFVDVPANAYFADAVKWAVDKGITNGLSDMMFGPYESCTRAQIVTFLWRAAGSPEPKTASSFADVPASAYYAKAVAWAVENGITNGMTETTFAPNATCTRGQSVTFLHRALGKKVESSASFTDVKSDAFYADAINWAVANNVTNGTSNTTFSPNADCTRAEIVTFLYRAYQGK